jgi:hypothetical protein
MITNSSLTIYHNSGLDVATHFEKWERYNYSNVWFFGGKGAGINKGYDNANDVQIRIPYNQNENLDINNFAIGDIIVQGTLDLDIQTQQDLEDYLIYNITSINNNNFGNNQHIHIGGK